MEIDSDRFLCLPAGRQAWSKANAVAPKNTNLLKIELIYKKTKGFIRFVLFTVLIVFFSPACKSTQAKQAATDSIRSKVDFDWLLGDWHRTNDQAGMQTFESWRKENALSYHGTGFTMQMQDTVFLEHITLHHENDKWYFDVSQQVGSATRFMITEILENSFLCSSPENDFPKEIRYHRDGVTLQAVISGDGKEVSFNFEPREIFR